MREAAARESRRRSRRGRSVAGSSRRSHRRSPSGAAMAIEPGRGAHAVPVRQGVSAVVVGDRRHRRGRRCSARASTGSTETPSAYGYNWDAHYGFCQDVDSPDARAVAAARQVLRNDRGVAGRPARSPSPSRCEGHPINAYAIVPLRGRIAPTVIDGLAADTGPRSHSAPTLRRDRAPRSATGRDVGEHGDGTSARSGPWRSRCSRRSAREGRSAGGRRRRRPHPARGLSRLSETAFDGCWLVVRWAPGTDEGSRRSSRILAAECGLARATRRHALVPLEVHAP